MAEEKITIVDLRRTIARQMSLPEETAGKFLAALFPAILEGLKQDKNVRISGLGCFKLVWIEPRKSVNVQTGESILIEGYNKVTFIPDSYIREQINEPFAGLEAVRVDENGQPVEPESTIPGLDPRVRFGEQVEEIKDLLADLGQDVDAIAEAPQEEPELGAPEAEEPKLEAPEAEEPEEEPQPEKKDSFIPVSKDLLPIIIDEPDIPEIPDIPETPESPETPEKPEKPESPETPEKPDIPEKPAEPIKYEPIFIPTGVPSPEPEQPKKKEKKFRWWLVVLIAFPIILLAAVAAWFVLVNKTAEIFNHVGEKEEIVEVAPAEDDRFTILDAEPLQPMDSATDAAPATTEAIEDEAVEEEHRSRKEKEAEKTEAKEAEKKAPVTPEYTKEGTTITVGNRVYTNIIKSVTLTNGNRLAQVARRCYGNSDYWVFIYESNRDVLRNPDRIPNGKKVKIYELPETVKNMSEEQVKALTQQLHDEYTGK